MRSIRTALPGAIILVFIGFGCSDDDDVFINSNTVVGSGVAAVDIRPLAGFTIDLQGLAG